jgi:hypothetical protein
MAAILCRDNEGESEWMSGLNLLGDHHAACPYEALRWLKRVGSAYRIHHNLLRSFEITLTKD